MRQEVSFCPCTDLDGGKNCDSLGHPELTETERRALFSQKNVRVVHS